MPILLQVNYEDGTSEMMKFPVQVWRHNNSEFTYVMCRLGDLDVEMGVQQVELGEVPLVVHLVDEVLHPTKCGGIPVLGGQGCGGAFQSSSGLGQVSC